MTDEEIMMLMDERSGFEEWNEEVDEAWGVGTEAWINDLINEKIERELHRQYSWY